MKFAVAAVFAALGLSDAKRISTAQKKSALLRKAVPVNKDGTRRQLNGEWEITAYHTISFNDCLSLTWQNEDALEENFVDATAAGIITPQTSYAVFEVINSNSDSNYYGTNEGQDLWMLPLADWVEATGNTEFEEKEKYCEACEESYDYCYPEEEEADEDGDRKLKKRKLTDKVITHREAMSAIMGKRRFLNGEYQEYVNCAECEERGCFEEEEDDENANICDEDNWNGYYDWDGSGNGCTFDDEAVQDFMEDAACRESGLYVYDADGDQQELMAGLMCNSDGSGVEMAMFADEDCSLYYTQKSFATAMEGSYLLSLLGLAEATIMEPYINAINCMGSEYLALGEDEEEEEEDDDGEGPDISETCENIMNEATDVSTCGGAEREYENNQYENYQNNQDEDGNYIPDIWYTYDFTNGEEPEAEDICFYLQDLNGEFSSKHVYNGDAKNGGGNYFDYQKAKNSQNGGGGAGKAFIIIAGLIVAAVAGVMIFQNVSNKRDSKRAPLVEGAMA